MLGLQLLPALTRNLEIGNTLVWVLPNIWRLESVKNTKFGTNVSNKMLLNAAKTQGYSFTVSELLRENQECEGRLFIYLFKSLFTVGIQK